MPTIHGPGVSMLVGGEHKPGDQAPSGYIDRQDWADVQRKAGLRQVTCVRCSRYRFPQQLSAEPVKYRVTGRNGVVRIIDAPQCNDCTGEKPRSLEEALATAPAAWRVGKLKVRK